MLEELVAATEREELETNDIKTKNDDKLSQ